MEKSRRLNFLVLRYTPSVMSDSFVNMAILGHEVDTGTFSDARFLDGWEPVLKLDANADVEMLEALKKEIQSGWPNIEKRETLLGMLLDSFSNSVQITQHTCLTNNPEDEMCDLAHRLLSPTAG
jgi:hypothetical protein